MENLVFETVLGYMAIAQRGETVLALCFGHSSERSALRALASRIDTESVAEMPCVHPPEGEELVERLKAFALGALTDFGAVPVDMSGKTDFQRKVLEACRAIPWGSTRTYGELAQEAGSPGAARAVGSVMASNRIPLIIPCHRVLPASGGLGGFSAPQGVAMKRHLLASEGSPDALLSSRGIAPRLSKLPSPPRPQQMPADVGVCGI